MNRSTVLPVYGTKAISQNDSQRNEIMKGSVHIRRGSKAGLALKCTEG